MKATKLHEFHHLHVNVLLCTVYHCVSFKIDQVHEISNNVVCATSKASDQLSHTHSLIRAFASRLTILLLLSY